MDMLKHVVEHFGEDATCEFVRGVNDSGAGRSEVVLCIATSLGVDAACDALDAFLDRYWVDAMDGVREPPAVRLVFVGDRRD